MSQYEHTIRKALAAGRVLREWSQSEMAEKMAVAMDDPSWNENRITAIENGRRKVSDIELRAFAEVQGFDVSFYWYGPPLLERRVGAVPGHVNPVSVNPLQARVNSLSDEDYALKVFGMLPKADKAKDLEPAGVTRIHTPNLFERYVDLTVEKQAVNA